MTKKQDDREDQDDQTFCDIMGEWGLYQWSICLFATLYSALVGITVVVGPIWTPDMEFACVLDDRQLAAERQLSGGHLNQSGSLVSPTGANLSGAFLEAAQQQQQLGLADRLHECSKTINLQQIQCKKFIYNDEHYGRQLTNSFDLVCERAWLRSFVSSSALIGMVVSSVTLGLVSDKLGRLHCIRIGFYLGLVATAFAIFAHNYTVLNVCVFFMSYAQIGAANALCTLLMEATSPKYRIVAIFEYGFGWGIGIALVPALNELTHDYKWFLGALLILQLLMLPWLHMGIFESIRWLLSEGHVNRAQIELGRACRINGVRTDTRLAKSIAHIQTDQMRRASRIIEAEAAPEHLARALGGQTDVGKTTHELDLLSDAIKRSFGLLDDDTAPQENNRKSSFLGARRVSTLPAREQQSGSQAPPAQALNNLPEGPLSPTLARKSFSIELTPAAAKPRQSVVKTLQAPTMGRDRRLSSVVGTNCSFAALQLALPSDDPAPPELQLSDLANANQSEITKQDIVRLAMKYSKKVEQQADGSDRCFLLRMFDRRLWRETVILTMTSIVLEMAYYGFIQANKFVGSSVNLNYLTGAAGEWASAFVSTAMMVALSRRVALVLPLLLASCCCFAMALSYHFLSAGKDNLGQPLGDDLILFNNTSTALLEGTSLGRLERDSVNFYIMNLGKFAVSIAIQVAAAMSIEAYPSNLRQTASGAIIFIGRCGSVVAPFLFNDSSPDKWVLQITLTAMAAIGLLVSLVAPFTLGDLKNKELRDHMNDIE